MPRIKDVKGKVEPIKRKWLNTKEAAEYMGCKPTFLRELRQNNLVVWASTSKGDKGRAIIWFLVDSLDAYIEKRMVNDPSLVKTMLSIL